MIILSYQNLLTLTLSLTPDFYTSMMSITSSIGIVVYLISCYIMSNSIIQMLCLHVMLDDIFLAFTLVVTGVVGVGTINIFTLTD